MLLTKHIKLFLFVLIPYSFGVLPSNAQVYFDSTMKCVLDDKGSDKFWFCGQQSRNSCYGSEVWRNNTIYTYNHGEPATIQGTNYYCCAGDGYDSDGNRLTYSDLDKGRFVQAPIDGWIKETRTITETFPGGGKCTWTQKINVCGMVENPQDKCTEPNNCDIGLILRNKVCIALCDESANMAFASKTSNTCISCEPTKSQGIVNHTCIKCDERTEVFDIEKVDFNDDKDKNGCVSKTTKLLAQTTFFDECWLCYTPKGLGQCLKNVSEGESVPAECDLNYNPDTSDSE